ncbi:MAG: hemolysin family protein, partial [Actinomycetota bacterium]|nr:hemolysin family protein [Actinomycetota bacterium]
ALALVAVGLLVAVNAVFVAVEFALLASSGMRLESDVEEGRIGAARALAARRDLRRQLSGAQLGITASSVALGILAEPAIGRLFEPLFDVLGLPTGVASATSLVVALGLAAIVQMLLGELVPKNVAIAEPERTLRALVGLHGAFLLVLRPAIWLLDRLVGLVVRVTGRTPVDRIEHETGVEELAVMFDASWQAGLLESFERELLAGALDLGTRPAAAVMIPRSRVVTINRRMTLAEVERVIVESGHSRLPVASVGSDHLMGVVLSKDLLRLPVEAQDEAVPLEVIRRALVVSPDLLLEDVLLQMRSARNHLAVVREPDKGEIKGRTLGVLTMQDVLEELVGDINDEPDTFSA